MTDQPPTSPVQPKDEIEAWYASGEDPWQYDGNPDDLRRKAELLAVLPERDFGRTLDIGCGNAFITCELPGSEVVGVDLSENAVGHARLRAAKRPDARRFRFEAHSLFDCSADRLGTFDLVVVTGVLYEQYIGRARSVAARLIDDLLKPGGVLVNCHIDEWAPPRLPYTLLDAAFYPYRGYEHRLEVMVK